MTWKTGCHSPALRRRETAASGTTWPSITTSCEPEPRIPSVCQVSISRTCGEARGMAKCRTSSRAPSSPLRIAPVTRRSAHGRGGGEDLAGLDAEAALDAGGLAAAADPVGAAGGDEDKALGRDALSRGSTAATPWCRQRQAGIATWCVCMASARAVEPQWRASVRSMSESSAGSAPPPPSSVGTPASRKPWALRSAKFSAAKASVSSSCWARSAKTAPRASAFEQRWSAWKWYQERS